MNNREKEMVKQEVERVVAESRYELFDLRIGQDRSLHVVIDKNSGRVSVDEIARFNLYLRNKLTDAGIAVDDWSVDVESPGALRPLRTPAHFIRFVGERIRIVRRDPTAKDRVVVGMLERADTSGFRLKLERGDVFDLTYADVSDARLDPKLPF